MRSAKRQARNAGRGTRDDGEPSDIGATEQRPLHPSMPAFAAAPVDDASIEAMAWGMRARAADTTPVELLEAQLLTASDQLRVARERLVRSRRRVVELERAVGQIDAFLQVARRRSAISA